MAAPHRARRLRWQARTADAAQAFALRALLRERSDEVRAALAQALDRVDTGDAVWRVPRLHLRLQARDLEALATQWPERFAQALAEGLQAALQGRPRDAASMAQADEPAVHRVPAPQHDRALLLHYLDTGLLDWTLAGLPIAAARQRLESAAQSLAQAEASVAMAAWPRDREARERWLLRWFWLLPVQTWRALVLRLWNAQVTGPESDAPSSVASPGMAARRLARVGPFARDDAPAQAPPGLPVASRDEARADPSLLVPDAGLVLLHPFLPRLFTACGLWRESAPRELDAPRAAALLHWLAHGKDEPAQEFELPLVKLLLGLSTDEPLVPVPVRDEDRAQGEVLLHDAIAHWRALGSSGIDALRASFLQRRGLLEARGDAWHLRVESAPFDTLLGRLPWPLNYVKLPWMTRSLAIDWTAP